MRRPGTMMSVMRHEGWHAAQDCMAGTIENNFIAIIKNEEDVPGMYQAIAKSAYKFQPEAIPWEKEAYWAGHTEGMTAAALESCAAGTMWTDYEPTPKTREWLVEEGFISSANLKELLVSDNPEELVDLVVNHERPSDDNWTKRLGL